LPLALYTLEDMPITLRELVDQPKLKLAVVAGAQGLDNQIRWVHTSELTDPTQWLSGGELLLTTGMGFGTTKTEQRSYLKRLVEANLSALGLGVGLGLDRVPEAIRQAADEAGFPVLEVPYPTPFIAIAEAISSRHAEDRLKDAQMSVDVHEQLTSAVSEGAGISDLLDEMVALAPGWAILFDQRGDVLAKSAAEGVEAPDARAVWRRLPDGLRSRRGPTSTAESTPQGALVGLAVRAAGRQEAVLVFGKGAKLDQRDRIVVHHAVTVLGLLLISRRAVVQAERRMAGDILGEAFAGRLEGDALLRRLELVGFGRESQLTVLIVEFPDSDEQALEDLAWAVDVAAGTRSGAARVALVKGKVVALVDHAEPHSLAEVLAEEVAGARDRAGEGGGIRVGVGETVSAGSIRHSYITALFALRAAPPARRVASPRDLGSYGFLLAAQSRTVLEGFVRSVLGPLIDRDEARHSELVQSVRAFIESGGRWEHGADELGVHRHTLRYRVRQAEELLQRDLTHPEDRLEVWLALKAAEVLEE
jgi:PucR family transcriptional regulator, purine catabolism regulatory protein